MWSGSGACVRARARMPFCALTACCCHIPQGIQSRKEAAEKRLQKQLEKAGSTQ